MTASLQLATTNVDKVTVNSCTFGKLSSVLLKTELNNFFRIFTPIINADLRNNTFLVPSNFGIMTLTALTIGYYNDYIYLGMTPVFKMPTPPAEQLAVEQHLALYQ